MTAPHRLRQIEAFVRVGELRSFAASARALGIGQPATSRAVAALEAELGVRLLQRTTRRVALTEAGALYLERARRILGDLAEADALVQDRRAGLRGILRVEAPTSFGRLHLGPMLPALLRAHPELHVDLNLSDALADVVAERIDVAIRIGELADSRLIAVRLGPNRRVLVASPDYVRRHGAPRQPSELTGHRLLHFSPMRGGDAWRLVRRRQATTVAVAPMFSANNAEVLQEVCMQGEGIGLLATFLVGDSLQRGRLVQVLPGWEGAPSAIHAVYPAAQYLPSKVRLFVDFLRRRFRGRPPWEPKRA